MSDTSVPQVPSVVQAPSKSFLTQLVVQFREILIASDPSPAYTDRRREVSVPGVFISYRRGDDSSAAGRVYDRLVRCFGKDLVFMDVDTLRAGAKFQEVIERTIGTCDAIVVLIGKKWLDATDEHGGRRLDRPDDWVHVEVATALRRNIHVVPVLIDGAPMPDKEQLPSALAGLAGRHALDVTHSRFHEDVDRLIQSLEETRSADQVPSGAATTFWSTPPGRLTLTASILSALGILLFLLESRLGLLSSLIGVDDPWLVYYVLGVPVVVLIVWLPLRFCRGEEEQKDTVKTVFIFIGVLATLAVVWRMIEIRSGTATDLFGRHSYVPYFVVVTIGIVCVFALILKYTAAGSGRNKALILKYCAFLCVYLLVCRLAWEWIDMSARASTPRSQVTDHKQSKGMLA